PNEDSAPAAFDFSTMRPGRIFTMAGERYRYLEDMDNGNHMIIRDDAIRDINFYNQEGAMDDWYSTLSQEVKDMVQPVSDSFDTGQLLPEDIIWDDESQWMITNLADLNIGSDVTEIDPSGSPRAFVLSVADVLRLSGPGRGFPTALERGHGVLGWWWTRTPWLSGRAWRIGNRGGIVGPDSIGIANSTGGMRPALIINQGN
ncbi:hypothetical protein AALA58_08295, partial [Lactococcus ileimucosae]